MTNGTKILGLLLFFGATGWWFSQRTNPQTFNQTEVLTSSATAIWDANPEPDIAGYRLYFWSQTSPTPTVIPSTGTSVTVNLSPDIPYSFRVTAVNTAQMESAPSGTVVYTVPTPGLPVDISGTVFYCGNPFPNATLTLTGGTSMVVVSDQSGNYLFSSLLSGGTYSVLPTKTRLPLGDIQINTVDLVAVRGHFLGTPLTGCSLDAADVTGDGRIDTVDVTAIQRFSLGLSTGTGNVGKYQFSPPSRNYPSLATTQTGQDYDVVLLGDVVP